MQSKDVISLSQQADKSITVFSTGQNPEYEKDFLVIGSPPRDEFFETIVANIDKNIDCSRSDDAIIINDYNRRIGIAYYNKTSFLQLTDDLARGKNVDPIIKHWSQGPWLPETFASDLSRSIVLSNGNREVVGSAKQFCSYPEEMRQAIRQRCLAEISIKASFIESSAKEQSLVHMSQLTDLCISGLRLAYANEKIYFRGLRYELDSRRELSQQGQELCGNLCDRMDFTAATSLINTDQ